MSVQKSTPQRQLARSADDKSANLTRARRPPKRPSAG